MPQTSDTSDAGKPLKTERRLALDGGIDTRAGPLTIGPDKVTALGNFRFGKGGTLLKRKGGTVLATVNAFASVAAMPVPLLVDAGGGGTLGAGTYAVMYTMGTVSTPSGVIGPSATSLTITVLANHNVNIIIPSPNSGEGLGIFQVAGADDPQNSGFLLSGANFGLYVKKTGDPNFTLQPPGNYFVLGPTSTGSPADGRLFQLKGYSNTGAVAPAASLAPVPIRSLYWIPLVDALVGISGETPWALQTTLTVNYLTLAVDKSGNSYGFSRLPTRPGQTMIERSLIISDAVGRPKMLNTPASGSTKYGLVAPTSWSFRMLGATAPTAAATNGAKVAGALTGTYQYVYTYVYKRERQDGTFFLSESNSSPVLTVTYAAQQAPINIAAPSESGIVSWNLYRTIAGGTTFFLESTLAIGTLSFADNTTDANLTGQQPPDKSGKIPNDTPPAGLAMVTEHAGRGFGVQSRVLFTVIGDPFLGQYQVPRASNVVQYSKVRFANDLISIGGNITVAPGDFGNIDAWPSIFQFPCGNASPITNLVSFRGVLYVFKEDEIGVIEGTTDNDFSYRTIWTGTGAMENSIIQVGNFLLGFDQALGPILVSGYSVVDLGYDTIQQDWLAAVTTDGSGEAVSGGGRGGTQVISAIWDPVSSEARWVISNFNPDPNSAYATGTTPTYFEYVVQMAQGKPTQQFTRFTGTVNGTTGDRRIGAQAAVGVNGLIFRTRDAVFGDYHGRLVLDNQSEGDLNGASAINVRATFPYFFGDSPEMVKLFRYIYMMFTMGANVADSLVLKVQSLVKGGTAPVTASTLAGAAATAGQNQQKRIALPASIDGTNNKDRGVQVVLTGSAISGPLTIEELALKYQDSGDRSLP